MPLEIRKERHDDIEEISQVVGAAFGSEVEASLVSLIRLREQSLLSLVAIQDEQIVGHVLVSPITITPSQEGKFGGLAPLSVDPRCQGKGIGSALMLAAIDECKGQGLNALFLLGSPNYYPRFGFTPSHLDNEYGASDAFMHLELRPDSIQSVRGLVKYVSAFNEPDA